MIYYVGTFPCDSNYLEHHGIKGQKWGVRRYQNADRTWTDEGKIRYGKGSFNSVPQTEKLVKDLKEIRYKKFDKLMRPEEVKKNKRGSCHDQVMYEMDSLRKMGVKPKAHFVIEYDDNGQGGMTHSFVTYKKGGKTVWLDNAWNERQGENVFESEKSIMDEIYSAHRSGEYGNIGTYKNLYICEFDDRKHKPGESLAEFVDKCLE